MAKLEIRHFVVDIETGPNLMQLAIRAAMLEAARRTVTELRLLWPVKSGLSRQSFTVAMLGAGGELIAVVNPVWYSGITRQKGHTGPLENIVEPMYDRHLNAVLVERSDEIDLAVVSEVLAPLTKEN